MDALAVGLVLLAILAALGAALCYRLLVRRGRLLLRVEALERALAASAPAFGPEAGLPAGSVLLDFELWGLGGGRMALSSWRGRRILLIFVQPGCPFSRWALSRVTELAAGTGGERPRPVVLTTGDVDENRQWFSGPALGLPVGLQEGTEVATLNRIGATPAAYLVDERGTTVDRLAVGAEEILILAVGARLAAEPPVGTDGPPFNIGVTALPRDRSLGEALAEPTGLAVGSAVPSFRVPRLDGGELTAADLRRGPTLLIFADPSCEACLPLLPTLERLHRAAAGPSVLMISRGTLAANRELAARHGLTFPIGIQRHWDVSRAFGLQAAPVGFLIDERGAIASEAAVGVERILALAPLAGTKDGTGGADDVPGGPCLGRGEHPGGHAHVQPRELGRAAVPESPPG